jgi:hypothetical protein
MPGIASRFSPLVSRFSFRTSRLSPLASITIKFQKSRKIHPALHDTCYVGWPGLGAWIVKEDTGVDLMRDRVMFSRFRFLTSSTLLGFVVSTGVGCVGIGPNLGPFAIPIPISPFFQEQAEDAFIEHERYDRVPIMGPITSGGPAVALDPPSDDEIMRTLERTHPVEGGMPFLHEVQRSNVRIVKSLIADYVDPPRHYPLVGPAQLHHAHYKCTVYFSETKRVGWPMPHTEHDQEAVEVIYIDHNHLHIVGNVDGGPDSNL